MVKLDMYTYELFFENDRLVYIQIEVESELDPTISDIVSELIAHRNKAYIEGRFGIASNVRIIAPSGSIYKTYLGMDFLQQDRRDY